MALTLKESGLLDQLGQDRNQLVCDAFKEARDESGNLTTDSVVAAMDILYTNTVAQTLSVFDKNGFFTIADIQAGTITDVVHQEMADEWFASINS